jgi:hypothetical protein
MKKYAFERGQTLPIIAATALLLVAVAGFAADTGYHQYEQRVQQTATDSAALAAAAEFNIGNYATAGQRDATSNGFTQGVNSVTLVNIGRPSAPDPYAGNPSAVEADISATYPTFFEKVFGITAVTVSTKAVAIANSPTNWCIVALDTTGTTNIDAHSVINAPSCDIAVNNSHLSIGGQSTVTTADPIEYSGSLTGAGTSTFSPGAPVTALPASDPCPQIASCLYLQKNPPASASCPAGNFRGSGTISPGTYCDVTFTGNTTLIPGQYVITGSLSANTVTLSGNDVTIIQTSSNCPNVNNASFALSAPTSGGYTGMLWYDPYCQQNVTLNGGDGGLQGMLYFPKANLLLNSGMTAMMMVVAGQLSLNSSNTTFSPLTTVQVMHPRLVE